MTTPHAINFLVVGLGMIAGPALWPQFFAAEHLRSAIWLVVMGGLQALAGSFTLGLAGIRFSRQLAQSDPFDFSLTLPDVSWAVPPSFYSLLDDDDEIVVALRLQQQLRRAA